MTPQARSMKYLRDRGWIVAPVERFNYFTKRRHDAFGFGDLLAAHREYAPILVQVTSTANMSARERKIVETPEIRHCAAIWGVRGVILLHGWAKRGARGKRKTWTLSERRLEVL